MEWLVGVAVVSALSFGALALVYRARAAQIKEERIDDFVHYKADLRMKQDIIDKAREIIEDQKGAIALIKQYQDAVEQYRELTIICIEEIEKYDVRKALFLARCGKEIHIRLNN